MVAFILYKHYNRHNVVFLVQGFNSYVIPFQVWTLAPSPNTLFDPPPQTPLLLIFLEVELESSYCKQMYAKQTYDEDKVILVAYLEHYICNALCLKISDEQIVYSTRYFTRLTIILNSE